MKTFKRVLVATEGTALRREYASVEAEFERLGSRSSVPVSPPPSVAVSPRQQWDKAVGEANHLVALGARGLDEDELREVLAEEFHRSGGKDLVVKALMVPDAPPPERTLQDAVKHYLAEN